MMMALIINKNNPKVTRVTGKVRMTSMGLIKKLRKLKTTATRIAVVYVSTPTPGSILDNTTTAMALNKRRTINFILKNKAPCNGALRYKFFVDTSLYINL